MSEAFIKKNIKLSLEFDDYLVKHPELFSEIPHGAYLVITVKNDASFNTQSMSLIRNRQRKNVVEAHKSGTSWAIRPLTVVV